MEPVWHEWLAEISFDEAVGAENNNIKKEILDKSLDYAWNWFSYHAGQRLIVFRYYLMFVSIMMGGFLLAFDKKIYPVSAIIAVSAIVISLVFWRLDVRNKHLVKNAERFLLEWESFAWRITKLSSVRLTYNADIYKNNIKKIYRYSYSFSQLYNILFFFIIGLFVLAAATAVFWPEVGKRSAVTAPTKYSAPKSMNTKIIGPRGNTTPNE